MPVVRDLDNDEAGDALPPHMQNLVPALMMPAEDINADEPHRNSLINYINNIIRAILDLWRESALDTHFISFLTLAMFTNVFFGLIIILEVIFHVKSHKLNEQLQPILTYRSPLHELTRHFCKKCYNYNIVDYIDIEYEYDTGYEGSDSDTTNEY